MGKHVINWSEEFADLPRPVMDSIVQKSVIRTFSNNSIIYFQEDDATSFHFVISGHVRLSYLMEDGTAILYTIVPPGHSFGELGVLDQGQYPDTASAIGTTQILSVKADLNGGSHNYSSQLETALGRLIAKRYRTYIDVTKGLYLKTLQARLAQSLLRLVDSLGEKAKYQGREVACLGPAVNQSDLGSMARGTRGNINRTLKGWELNDWVAIENRRILILDRQAIQNLTYDE
ncbi:MAG: Crp/Fnr family transcriptional regulator [Pseudomonadota bacterium]